LTVIALVYCTYILYS